MICISTKMNSIFNLIFLLGILGDLTVCQQFYPFPYEYQNKGDPEYASKSFNIANLWYQNPIQARNDTPNIPSTTNTTKPELTTETIIYEFIPVIPPEVLYQPDYYPIIPPYSAFYNAPGNPNDRYNAFVPLPQSNDATYVSEKVQFPSFFNSPSSVNIFPKKWFFPSIFSKPKPSVVKPPVEKPPSTVIFPPNEDNYEIEITDADRDDNFLKWFQAMGEYFTIKKKLLNKELESYTEKDIESIRITPDNYYRMTKPWSTSSPDIFTTAFKTSLKPDKNIVYSEKSLLPITDTFFGSKTTPSFIKENQFKNETDSDNETDDSRKLNFNYDTDETNRHEKFSFDKLIFVSSTDSPKVLKNNTPTNSSKLNDRFKGESKNDLKIEDYVDVMGNKCTEEVVKFKDKEYKLYTCEERTYDGMNEVVRKTTYKSDVTYFKNELTTTELAPQGKHDDVIFSETTEINSPKYHEENDTTSTAENDYFTTEYTN